MKKERLDKVLSNLGYGSRKELKNIIKNGRVKVNGDQVFENDMKIDPNEARIEFDGTPVDYKKYIYIMMNKPKGLVSSTNDPKTRTVIDLLDDKFKAYKPFPVGRLDKDTEGLMFISNDGKLAHDLLSPKKRVNKTYYVHVDGYVEESHKEVFAKGLTLDDGYHTLPSQLEIVQSDTISRLYLTIQEGKFHQVKRMFASLGMEVIYLKRLSIGSLQLDDSLSLGQYRELTEEEVKNLII